MPSALLIPKSFARLAILREKQSSETEETPREPTDLCYSHHPDPSQIIFTPPPARAVYLRCQM